MSVSYMKPNWTRIHVQTSFHRVTPCMQFCLHGLSPVLDIYGYIWIYRLELCSALTWVKPRSYPPDLGVLLGQPKALACAPRARANRNPSWTRIPLLLDLLDPIGGAGPRLPWAALWRL